MPAETKGSHRATKPWVIAAAIGGVWSLICTYLEVSEIFYSRMHYSPYYRLFRSIAPSGVASRLLGGPDLPSWTIPCGIEALLPLFVGALQVMFLYSVFLALRAVVRAVVRAQ